MDLTGFYELVAGGEDSFVEFKREVGQTRETRRNFADEMIAFANTEGGQILVGVEDDGRIVGLADKKATEEAILNLASDSVIPPLRVTIDSLNVENKLVFVVNIPRRYGHPYTNQQGQYYLRVGSTKRLATPQEVARLFQAVGLIHYDETPVLQTSFGDIDVMAVEEFLQRTLNFRLDETGLSLQQLLTNRRLMVSDSSQNLRVSVAGLLLFGKNPQQYLYHTRISAVRWVGNVAGEEMMDRQEITGRLPQMIDQAEVFVRRNTAMSAKIEGFKRMDRPQYPPEVMREAIVNAVAHRDYSRESSQIRLFIFDDRVEVHSPGGLPNSVTLDNMKTGFSAPRNRLITQLLSNLGYLSSFGTGVPRMIRLMKQHNGTEPEFVVDSAQITVKVWGI